MSDKPVYHGRDHRPGGADPIPGLGTVATVLIQGSQSFPSGADETAFFPGNPSSFVTNDPASFTVDGTNGFIQINRDGLYHFYVRLLSQAPITALDTELVFMRLVDPGRTLFVNGIADSGGYGRMGVHLNDSEQYAIDDYFVANLYNYEADTLRSFPFNLEVRFGSTYDAASFDASYGVVGYRYEPLATTWYN